MLNLLAKRRGSNLTGNTSLQYDIDYEHYDRYDYQTLYYQGAGPHVWNQFENLSCMAAATPGCNW